MKSYMRTNPDPERSVTVIYQDVKSGANVATEELVNAYRRSYPNDILRVHKQQAYFFRGRFAFLLNAVWSMYSIYVFLQSVEKTDAILSSLYTFTLPWQWSRHRDVPSIFYVHGDQRFRREPLRPSAHALYRRTVGALVDALQSYALKASTHLAFVSVTGQTMFAKKMDIPIARKSFILPNGVDTARFHPGSAYDRASLRRLHRAFGRFQLAYVGRADEKKGVHLLLASLRTLKVPVTLWIIYPSPRDQHSHAYLDGLTALSRSIPKRHRVRFVEDAGSVPDLYRFMDFLILPSRQEMLPLVLLEALASGVIPVATDVGDSGTILRRVSRRLVLRSDDPRVIGETLTGLMTLPQRKRIAIVKRGIREVARYTWEKTARALHERILTT